jgi:serine/threonine protein kinase
MNILHRDLKNSNIFITKDNVYKIGDLNVSKVVEKGKLAQT